MLYLKWVINMEGIPVTKKPTFDLGDGTSFLDVLDKYSSLFEITEGQIIELFHFPYEVYMAWTSLLARYRLWYLEECNRFRQKNPQAVNKDPNILGLVFLERDESKKLYLKIIGNNGETALYITRDDSNREDYKDLVGIKVSESEFISMLNDIRINRANTTNIPSLNICQLMNISGLLEYQQYLNEQLNPTVVTFCEAQNGSTGEARNISPSTSRRHDIIDMAIRRNVLMERCPISIMKFRGLNTGMEYEAYIYERNGRTLAVVEPVSGTQYQYNLNLGPVEDDELIKEMIKAALEAPEDIAMIDPAIMRKNHTTLQAFCDSLDTLLGKNLNQHFKTAVNKSHQVYSSTDKPYGSLHR